MNKKFLLFLTISTLLLLSVLLYSGIIHLPAPNEKVINKKIIENIQKREIIEYEVVEIARDLYVPWDIEFTSSERMLVTERNGQIREIVNDKLSENILYKFSDVSSNAEEGLMGMALHPNYRNNKYIYVCYAYSTEGGIQDRIVRLTDKQSELIFDRIILDNIPAARFHAGCRIAFGPDGFLYITTGDATDKNIAQDKNSLGGKILKVDKNGQGLEVFSLGHRNAQGIDWDKNGNLYSSEHGPSGFDGPGGGDELNLIIKGGNYGWPIVSHDKSREGLISPLIQWTPAIAPGSLLVYKSDVLPQFTGDIFIGGLRGEGIYRVILKNGQIGKWEKIVEGFGRIREVMEGPDGSIYFTTSNRDGRGSLNEGDDKIFKITSK